MSRSAVCFCILLLLIVSASAVPFSPAAVKVAVSPTTIQRAIQIPAHAAVVSCGEGAVNCNGRCTNINFDEMNCGTCGMTCFDPAVCCNGKCVDVRRDEMNCGSCGGMCFAPAKCCMGSCEDTCPYAQTDIVPSVAAEVAVLPAAGVAVDTTPARLAVHGVSGAIVSLPSTPHTPISPPYRNFTSATPVPQGCPSSDWTCMPLAQAEALFGVPYAQYGSSPCGYVQDGSQTVPAYCCRDVPGGSISPASLGALGIQKTDPGLHIINRTMLEATNLSVPAKPLGALVRQRQGFISSILGFFTGLLAKPVSCPEGKTNCGGGCTDTRFDETNCGTCGMTCFDPAVCCNGECVDMETDETNCGTCGMTCFDPAICCRGSCEDSCPDVVVEVTPTNNVVVEVTPTNNVVVTVTPTNNVVVVVTP